MFQGLFQRPPEQKIKHFHVQSAPGYHQFSNFNIKLNDFSKFLPGFTPPAAVYRNCQFLNGFVIAARLMVFNDAPQPFDICDQVFALQALVGIQIFKRFGIPAFEGATLNRAVFIDGTFILFFIKEDTGPAFTFAF